VCFFFAGLQLEFLQNANPDLLASVSCATVRPRSTLKKIFSADIRCLDRRRSSAPRRVSGVKEPALAERQVCQACRARQNGKAKESRSRRDPQLFPVALSFSSIGSDSVQDAAENRHTVVTKAERRASVAEAASLEPDDRPALFDRSR
jgi:hypothetical protein